MPEAAPPNLQSRYAPLDVLRAIAIGLVLGRHLLRIPSAGIGPYRRFLLAWRHFGWVGVDLFFVLSGFLVGGLLIQEALQHGTVRPVRFLIRRGLKIYPAFYTFLFFSLGLMNFARIGFPTWPKGFYSEIFFLQSYIPGLWPQTWSLAVEEHFYLILVAFFCIGQDRLLPRDRLPWLPMAVVFMNTVILFGRLWAGYVTHASWSDLLLRTHWRLDSLLFGVGLAYFHYCRPDRLAAVHRWLSPWQMIFLPLLIVPTLYLPLETSRFVTSWGLTSLYLGFGWIVIDSVLGPTREILMRVSKFLAPIGRHSYSIYLWHMPVYYLLTLAITRWAPMTPFSVGTLLYLSGAVGVGAAFSVCLEQPILRWRNRIIPSGSR